MRGGVVRSKFGVAGLLLWLYYAPAFGQVNLLGKPGLVYTPHPFIPSADRFVSTVTYSPRKAAINYFVADYSEEVMVSGYLPLTDRVFLGINLTYLPQLSERVGIGDRHVDINWLVVEENEGWRPSLMLILTPPFAASSFLSQDLLVAGKSFAIGSAELAVSAGYASPFFFFDGGYIRKEEMGISYLIGAFGGIVFRPIPSIGFLAEMDGRRTNLAANYTYKDKLSLKVNWFEVRTLGVQVAATFPLNVEQRELRRYEK
jgi:hypothetical protein